MDLPEISKLNVLANTTKDDIVDKLNELVDVYNMLREAMIGATEKIEAVPSVYTETQTKYMRDVLSCEITIEEVADLWHVAFYDDVTHEFTSPVYCVRCEYRSQSLLDRMLLNPNALCAGCIEKTKWG